MRKMFSIIACMLVTLVVGACGSSNPSSTQGATNSGQSSNNLNISMGDGFTIVDATYQPTNLDSGQCAIKLKIKNNTDKDYKQLALVFYGYDKNGERIDDGYQRIEDFDSGSTVWTPSLYCGVTVDNIGAIKISEYEIYDWTNEKHEAIARTETIPLDPKVEIKADQMRYVDEIDY